MGNTCSVDVTAEKFGDSCPGTFKYIEVHYSCVSGWFCLRHPGRMLVVVVAVLLAFSLPSLTD